MSAKCCAGRGWQDDIGIMWIINDIFSCYFGLLISLSVWGKFFDNFLFHFMIGVVINHTVSNAQCAGGVFKFSPSF